MKIAFFRWVTTGIIVFGLALIQTTTIIMPFGVKPNFILTALTALSFFVSSFTLFMVFVLGSLFIAQFYPYFEASILLLGLWSIIIFFMGHRLAGKPFFNNLFIIIVATIVFYAVIDFGFLRNSAGTVFLEIVCNVILGSVLFWIFKALFRENHEKKSRIAI